MNFHNYLIIFISIKSLIHHTFSTGRFGGNPEEGGFGLGPGLPLATFALPCSNGAFTDNLRRVIGLAGANGGGAIGGGGRNGGGGERTLVRTITPFREDR